MLLKQALTKDNINIVATHSLALSGRKCVCLGYRFTNDFVSLLLSQVQLDWKCMALTMEAFLCLYCRIWQSIKININFHLRKHLFSALFNLLLAGLIQLKFVLDIHINSSEVFEFPEISCPAMFIRYAKKEESTSCYFWYNKRLRQAARHSGANQFNTTEVVLFYRVMKTVLS